MVRKNIKIHLHQRLLNRPAGWKLLSHNQRIVFSILVVCLMVIIFKTPLSVVIPSFMLNAVAMLIICTLSLSYFLQYGISRINLTPAIGIVILSGFFLWALINPGKGVLNIFTLINFLQLLFPLVFWFLLASVSLPVLLSLAWLVASIACVLATVSVIEMTLIPNHIVLSLADYMSLAKLGIANGAESYSPGGMGQLSSFSYLRPGSLVFEPLTNASIIVVGFVFMSEARGAFRSFRQFLLFLVASVSMVKSALLTLTLSILFFILRQRVLLLMTFIACLAIYFSQPYISTFAGGERIEGFESISNHLLGLILGIKNTIEAPLFGHGLGSSGYLVYIESQKLNIVGPFWRPGFMPMLENGNESTFGVFVYQFGFIVTSLFVLSLLKASLNFMKAKMYWASGLMMGIIFFATLSESFLSFSIQVAFITITVCLARVAGQVKTYPYKVESQTSLAERQIIHGLEQNS